MSQPPYKITKREDWVFELTVDGATYRVVWMNYIREADGYEEHNLTTFKDGVSADNSDVNTSAAVEAARAYRMTQLKNEYGLVNPGFEFYSNRTAKLKEIILALAQRSWGSEYLGQYHYSWFYIQDVAAALDIEMTEAISLVDELMDEEKIGLNGFILIPHEDYIKTFEFLESKYGHKRLSISDFGYWHCSFCGASGEPEDETSPKDFACVKPSS